MCGIVVALTNKPENVLLDRAAVAAACERMAPRGPDAQGIWQGECVTLGHRRLAILDLEERANQPLLSACGRYAIVFNGEIYNFRELRIECEANGYSFRTDSDTEVLLTLFAAEGEAMLPRLRGMFAFAIWDAKARELFVARDPYGIKPLYYAQTSDGVVFASQVKALLATGLVSGEREPAGLAGFYLWGSVPEPWTLYRGVFALPAGNWMRVRGAVAGEPVCWHDIRQHWRGQGVQLAVDELQELVSHATMDSVRAHLVSDVPVCVFLSGGIDSSVIAALAAQAGAQVTGITIGFEEFAGSLNDETPPAAAIAAHFGLPHFVRRVSRAEFEADIPLIFNAMDQPSVDGVNTWFASKAATESGFKVALSGVGGDELFFGYSSFRRIPRAVALGRALSAIPCGTALLGFLCKRLVGLGSRPKVSAIPTFIGSLEGMYFLSRSLFLPGDLHALMGADLAREGIARLGGKPPGMSSTNAIGDAAAVGLLESTFYLRNQLLRDADWASMAHSLELRTPLIDARLLEQLGPYLLGFAGGAGKRMLAQSPAKRLPDAIINRPKTGFGLPMAPWLAAASDQRARARSPLLAAPGTQWARRWAKTVVEAMS